VTVGRRAAARGALAVGALGVVFGDIGTSPLYTVRTVFNPGDPHPVRVSAQNIFGIVSLIFWSVTIIVTVTYVLLVMRADNDGEGGIMALITLIRRRGVPGGRRTKIVLAMLGVFGASLFFGDSVIPPAISVQSAVEGVKVAAPSVAGLVVPVTAAIIVGLFLVQRLGTGAVGRIFGPVMGVWFTAIGVIGAASAAAHPRILKALSPAYAIGFLFGQAAQIGYLPRLRIAHTSEEQRGQIYVPWINWALMASVLTLVLTFKSSAALAYAFGMAVTGTITITTLLFFYIARYHWRWPLWAVAPGASVLLAIDLLFFAANLTKLAHGAWLPLLIAIAVFTILTTWQRGRELVTRLRRQDEGPLQAFIDQIHAMKPPLHRVPGTAVFLNRGKDTAPLALRANVAHNHVLHRYVLILSIETLPVPMSRPGSG
jgi:K+ transporter